MHLGQHLKELFLRRLRAARDFAPYSLKERKDLQDEGNAEDYDRIHYLFIIGGVPSKLQ